MTKLIISTPWYKKDKSGNNVGKPGQMNSWETYFQTGKGLGYILYPHEFDILQKSIKSDSCKLIMLRQDKNKKRAEANLTNLKQTSRQTKKGQWRYDIYFKNQIEIKPYVYNLPDEKLKENGVKVI